jgi:hypothetical protein
MPQGVIQGVTHGLLSVCRGLRRRPVRNSGEGGESVERTLTPQAREADRITDGVALARAMSHALNPPSGA